MFLNQKMSAFGTFNDSIEPMGKPVGAQQFYNRLQAKWNNGVHYTYGGTGDNPGSTDYTNYIYSGDPVTGTGWTEITPNGTGSTPNVPDDRRGLMSTGPITFSADETITIDMALPFARDYQGDNIASVALLKKYARDIQKFYDENLVVIKENTTPNNKLLVYPNPSNGHFTISSNLLIESIELYDIMGKKVFSSNTKVQTMQITEPLPQGLYVYRVVLQDQSLRTGKIIVQ